MSSEVLHLVYGVLRRHSVGGRCQLSVRELAEFAGLTHSTVHRALQRLRAYGMIDVQGRSYVGEASTIILVDPHGLGDITARALELAGKIKDSIGELGALLPSIAGASPTTSATAALTDELAPAIRNVVHLGGSHYAVIIDAAHLGPDARRFLRIADGEPSDRAQGSSSQIER